MGRWLVRYALMFLVIGGAVVPFWFLPERRAVNLLGPVVGAAAMFLVNRWLPIPDVVIRRLGEVVRYEVNRNRSRQVEWWIEGRLTNLSPTGVGDLSLLQLVVKDGKKTVATIQSEHAVYVGHRFKPHSQHPRGVLNFVSKLTDQDYKALGGRKAEIHVAVVGQRERVYRGIRLADKPEKVHENIIEI